MKLHQVLHRFVFVWDLLVLIFYLLIFFLCDVISEKLSADWDFVICSLCHLSSWERFVMIVQIVVVPHLMLSSLISETVS